MEAVKMAARLHQCGSTDFLTTLEWPKSEQNKGIAAAAPDLPISTGGHPYMTTENFPTFQTEFFFKIYAASNTMSAFR